MDPACWTVEADGFTLIQRQVVSQRIANRLIQVLESTSHDQDPHAPEFALLSIIFTVQDQVNEPTKGLLSYLLAGYQPLLTWMNENGEFEIEGFGFRRWLNGSGQFQLLARKSDWLEDIED